MPYRAAQRGRSWSINDEVSRGGTRRLCDPLPYPWWELMIALLTGWALWSAVSGTATSTMRSAGRKHHLCTSASEDDGEAGNKSMALLFRGYTKTLHCALLALMVIALVSGGWSVGTGSFYRNFAAGGSTTSPGLMIQIAQLQKTENCWS